MTNANLIRCIKCGRHLIVEELESHQCKHVIDYRIRDNILWLSDGERWYPRKLISPKNKHPLTTPKDSTEPNFLKNLN